MSESLLEVTDAARHFGGVKAVDGASFHIDHGEVFGLIGPNGAGKTTMVNLITGYYRPDHGEILLDGESVIGIAPHHLARRGLARTFQNLQLFEGQTVLQNVLIGRHRLFKGRRWQVWGTRRREEREQRIAAFDLLERLSLLDVADDDVADLPYGTRRRVEVARALAAEPRLLLLDEPTAGMTRKESDEIGELIRSVSRSGVTVLLVDHNVRLVTAACGRVAVMDWGQVVAEGTPTQVWADARVQKAYLGVNRKDGEVLVTELATADEEV